MRSVACPEGQKKRNGQEIDSCIPADASPTDVFNVVVTLVLNPLNDVRRRCICPRCLLSRVCFTISDSPSVSPSTLTVGRLCAALLLPSDGFKAGLAADVAGSLGLDKDRVVVTSVKDTDEGVVVTLEIQPPPDDRTRPDVRQPCWRPSRPRRRTLRPLCATPL
jgi:hypothetical protein